MKKLIWLLPLVVAVGCNEKDRTSAMKETEVAAQHAGKAAGIAWTSISKEIAQINLGSSQQDIQAAKKKAEEAKAKAEKSADANSGELSEIQKQIDRLKAALNVKKLQSEYDELLKKAKDIGSAAEDAKNKVSEGSKSLDQLKEKLAKAKQAYQELAPGDVLAGQ